VHISLLPYMPHRYQNNHQNYSFVFFFFNIYFLCGCLENKRLWTGRQRTAESTRVQMFSCIFNKLCIYSIQLFSNETFIFCASAGLVLILYHQEAVVCCNAIWGTYWTRATTLIDGGVLCIISFTVDLIDRGTIRVRLWETVCNGCSSPQRYS
jgi:hypothetical protein